jgi:DNA-binding transcriptional LysR family regulator
MFDKLRSMEVLLVVAEQGSFAAAARQLDLTPAMVGRHVQALETHLKTRLIQRSTRRQTLTEVGREFVQDCRQVMEQVRWAETAVERHRQAPQGLLRLSAPVTVGQCLVAPALARLLKEYPDLRVDLHLSDSLVDVAGDGFDAAIRIGQLHDDGLVAKPLRPYRMVIAATPQYLERYGVPQTPRDLHAHVCLSHSIWQRVDAGLSGWSDNPRMTINQGHALREAALEGLGLVMQPEVLLQDDLKCGRLQQVLQDHMPPPRAMHLVWLPDRQRLPKVQVALAWLSDSLGG